jgi:hypothetical protein
VLRRNDRRAATGRQFSPKLAGMNAPLKPEPSPAFAPAVFTDDEFEDFLGLPGVEKLGRFELRDRKEDRPRRTSGSGDRGGRLDL